MCQAVLSLHCRYSTRRQTASLPQRRIWSCEMSSAEKADRFQPLSSRLRCRNSAVRVLDSFSGNEWVCTCVLSWAWKQAFGPKAMFDVRSVTSQTSISHITTLCGYDTQVCASDRNPKPAIGASRRCRNRLNPSIQAPVSNLTFVSLASHHKSLVFSYIPYIHANVFNLNYDGGTGAGASVPVPARCWGLIGGGRKRGIYVTTKAITASPLALCHPIYSAESRLTGHAHGEVPWSTGVLPRLLALA